MLNKILAASAALLFVGSTGLVANAATHHKRAHAMHGTPGKTQGVGLSKQTGTGGPSGGSTKNSGGGS